MEIEPKILEASYRELGADGWKERRIQRRQNTCIHFNGMINPKCDAGVCYSDISNTLELGEFGTPVIAPCFQINVERGAVYQPTHACALAEFRTREEAEAEIDGQNAAMAEHLNKIAQNICPTHNISVTKKQVGCCVYADPCGCRLYQGRLKK